MRLIFQALFLLLPCLATAATPERLSELEALFAQRDDPAAFQALDKAFAEDLKAAPGDFQLLWRAARLKQWVADGAADERLKKQAGKEAWDLGDRARKLEPERVEGHFYAAAGLGAYAQAVGIMKALRQGLEGQFNERLDAATRADPDFNLGSPLIAKGRYYYELPWPKRKLDKSAEQYRKALAKHPGNLRAHLFLAETLLKDDEPRKAQAEIAQVMAGSIAYDPPEGRRVQQLAKKVQADIEKELK